MKRIAQTQRLPGGQIVTNHLPGGHDQQTHGGGGGGDKGPSDREYLPGKSEKGFSEYMQKVDKQISDVSGGLKSGDLVDVTFRDFYDSGKSPAYAAKKALRESGFRMRAPSATKRMNESLQRQRDFYMSKIGKTRDEIRALPAGEKSKLQDQFRDWLKTPEARKVYKGA